MNIPWLPLSIMETTVKMSAVRCVNVHPSPAGILNLFKVTFLLGTVIRQYQLLKDKGRKEEKRNSYKSRQFLLQIVSLKRQNPGFPSYV